MEVLVVPGAANGVVGTIAGRRLPDNTN
jgi:hypothetical protein